MKENDKEVLQSVESNHLSQAIDAIEADACYWTGAMTRLEAKALSQLLENKGYKIAIHEVPPGWEHVIAKQEVPFASLEKEAENRYRNF